MTETIVEFIILLIAHAAAGIYSFTLKYSKKITFLIWGCWILLQTGLMFCAEFLLNNWVLQFLAGFVLSLAGQYVIFFTTTKGKLAQRIFTMLTYSIFFCIVMTVLTIIKQTFPQLHPALTALMLSGLLSAVVAYFLCYVCPLCHAAAKNITAGWQPLIGVNIVFLVAVILSSVFPTRLTSFQDPAFITFIFLSVSIMAVYPVIFSNINSMSAAATKREVIRQNRLLLAQIEAEKRQLDAASQARHDRRHHNLVMLELANNNDLEGVKAYLRNLMENEDEVWGEVRYCENITVNTILTVYMKQAGENGIPVKVLAHVSRDVPVLSQDLVIVIANLFENAVHATAKLKNNDQPIDIIIKESAQRLLVKIENPCKEDLSFDEAGYGVGIRSVIATTNKYDGMYDFSAEGGTFSAKVSLNLK